KLPIERGESRPVAVDPGLEVCSCANRVAGRYRREETTFAQRRTEVKAWLGEEMPKLSRMPQQSSDSLRVAESVFDGHQVLVGFGELGVLLRAHQAARAPQVVVEEVPVGERAADLGKDPADLAIVDGAPRRQAELEGPDPEADAEADALEH